MVPPADMAMIVIILAFVLFEAWFLYDERMRVPKAAGGDHVHQGVECSRHDISGHTVVVYRCQFCQTPFSVEQS